MFGKTGLVKENIDGLSTGGIRLVLSSYLYEGKISL